MRKQIMVTKSWRMAESRHAADEIIRHAEVKTLRAGHLQRQITFALACGLHEVRTVDIGDEAKRHLPLAVVAQRRVAHPGPEICPADADIDDVADGPTRVTLPAPAAD